MATKARIVWGAETQWGADPAALVNLPEAKGLAVPVVQKDYADVTNLDSEGGFREYIPGLKDPGEIAIPCNYTSGGYAAAVGHEAANTLIHFETTLPLETGQSAGDKFTFTGYVTPELEQNETGDPIGMVLNIRVSGAVGFVQGDAEVAA